MRTLGWLSACVVNVGVSHHEGGGVAFNELRHDTACNLQTHEQRSANPAPVKTLRQRG